jgi:hypothetical protein
MARLSGKDFMTQGSPDKPQQPRAGAPQRPSGGAPAPGKPRKQSIRIGRGGAGNAPPASARQPGQQPAAKPQPPKQQPASARRPAQQQQPPSARQPAQQPPSARKAQQQPPSGRKPAQQPPSGRNTAQSRPTSVRIGGGNGQAQADTNRTTRRLPAQGGVSPTARTSRLERPKELQDFSHLYDTIQTRDEPERESQRMTLAQASDRETLRRMSKKAAAIEVDQEGGRSSRRTVWLILLGIILLPVLVTFVLWLISPAPPKNLVAQTRGQLREMRDLVQEARIENAGELDSAWLNNHLEALSQDETKARWVLRPMGGEEVHEMRPPAPFSLQVDRTPNGDAELRLVQRSLPGALLKGTWDKEAQTYKLQAGPMEFDGATLGVEYANTPLKPNAAVTATTSADLTVSCSRSGDVRWERRWRLLRTQGGLGPELTLMGWRTDAWGKPVKMQVQDRGTTVDVCFRSAGPDGQFQNEDDVAEWLKIPKKESAL